MWSLDVWRQVIDHPLCCHLHLCAQDVHISRHFLMQPSHLHIGHISLWMLHDYSDLHGFVRTFVPLWPRVLDFCNDLAWDWVVRRILRSSIDWVRWVVWSRCIDSWVPTSQRLDLLECLTDSLHLFSWKSNQQKCSSPNRQKGMGSQLHAKELLVRLPVVCGGLECSSLYFWCRHMWFSIEAQLVQPCQPVLWQSLDSSFHHSQQHEQCLSPRMTWSQPPSFGY